MLSSTEWSMSVCASSATREVASSSARPMPEQDCSPPSGEPLRSRSEGDQFYPKGFEGRCKALRRSCSSVKSWSISFTSSLSS